ncbi:MAG: radical SAM protein, partial [Oscillospiraceae bacterium]
MNENSNIAKKKLLEYNIKYAEKNNHQPLVYLQSFGCQQNVSDGEKLKGKLSEIGYGFTDNINDAQFILYNTCAVRENAEDKVYAYIGNLKHMKENNPDLIIGICGCMAQEQKTCETIKKTYRQVDLVFGTFAYNDLYNMLWEIISDKKRVFNIAENNVDINEDFTQIRDNKVQAFVPIMYGCNNFCSYCIVPYVRGRERSRKPDSVISEVKELVEQGYKEITLLGQNVNSYSYGFPELLREINKI